MIINLNDYRPQNESLEHFLLKQVGRAFLFNQGIRCIATEVRASGLDNPPFGKKKSIIDVIGIDKRNKHNKMLNQLRLKIEAEALKIGSLLNLTEKNNWDDRESWINFYVLNDLIEKEAVEKQIEACRNEACINLGYKEDLHKYIGWAYSDVYQIRGIEAKATYADFKNGFCVMPEYSYIIAPIGLIPVRELPSKVGLLELNIEEYSKNVGIEDWGKYLTVTKKPKKKYDSFFMDKDNPKKFRYDVHAKYCRELLFDVAQENTEELVFWNPHLRNVDKGYNEIIWDHMFKYKIGQEVSSGIVVERNLKYQKRNYGADQYYKFARKGEGITGWIKMDEFFLGHEKVREVVSNV